MIDTPQLRIIYLTEEKRMTTRKKYTQEYKLDAVGLVKDQNLNRSEV
ncbi:MAG: transposase-like protein, partial [Gammaproteobacteria bacterium]